SILRHAENKRAATIMETVGKTARVYIGVGRVKFPAMDNRAIAATLEELANLYALAGGSDFYRERGLRSPAEAGRSWPDSAEVMAREGRLTSIQGVGPGIAARIGELCRTGTLAEYESLRKEFPPSLSEILQVPGMGIKTARKLHEELGVEDLATLEEAALD